ncbi:hypothetical protein [uncultured Arcticibacterium sp.]|uniref:hypothetical protein n=1 Tax=uncultured Arcticibacterium sp. TaxID=2173042 RepID=UPI0030F6477C
MLRELAKSIFHQFPESVQHSFRKYEFNKWASSGRSIPPPQVVKLFKIHELQETYNCNTFIETGTYKGDMIFALKSHFKKLITVELSPLYYNKAVERFKKDRHVELNFGDSGDLMPKIIKKLSSTSLFWLDGHFSSGETAQGEMDCPIYGELRAIFSSPYNHVLLIDDARCFTGENDYPTIPELSSFIEKHKPGSFFEVKDDLITVIVK